MTVFPRLQLLSICNDFFTRGIIYLRQSGWGDLFNCLFMVFARVEKGTSFRMIELHGSPRLQIRRQPSRTLYLMSKSLKFAMRIEHEQQEFPSKQWLRNPAAVRPLDEANNGCWILRTRGSLRRMSCQVPSQRKSLPDSTCSNSSILRISF